MVGGGSYRPCADGGLSRYGVEYSTVYLLFVAVVEPLRSSETIRRQPEMVISEGIEPFDQRMEGEVQGPTRNLPRT